MINSLATLKRQKKALLMLAADAILLPLALWSAFALRLGESSAQVAPSIWLVLLAPAYAIPVFIKLGLYRAIVRYMNDRVVWVVLAGVSLSVLLMIATVHLLQLWVPRSVFLIYWGIAALYVGGSRFVARGVILGQTRFQHDRVPVVIYGAGAAGTQVAMALRAGKEFKVVAFVDDDPERHRTSVAGISVFPSASLADLLQRYSVKSVLFAMPSISRVRRNAIMDKLENLHVRLLTIPGMAAY
jgi:FlaA1/EpsC-like NDP-sugar epimerase